MGQKVHPIGIRLGVIKKHNANWYANPKQYSEYLLNDFQVRNFLRKKLEGAMVSHITLSVQLVLQKSRFIVHALVLSLVKKVKISKAYKKS